MSTDENERRRRRIRLPFAAIPHAVYADRRLTPGDRDLLAVLTRYALNKPTCWPSNQRLSQDLRVTRRTVQARLRRLEAAGWLVCKQTCSKRVIHLNWRDEDEDTPPGHPPSHRPAKPVAPEEDRNRKEKQLDEKAAPPRWHPDRTTNPPARPSSGDRLRVGPTTEELREIVARTNDPILAKELFARSRPRPEPGLPPATTEEMIARLHEDPSYVSRLAENLAQDFDDRKSWNGFYRAVERAWQGEIPLDRLADAYKQAMGPKSRNRGAVFMTAMKRDDP